jgi:hypothetical protein
MARGQNVAYGPVGPTINNGLDLGGARIYPFSTGLAITPPSMYSDYIGSASGLPVSPPVAAQAGTTGVSKSSTVAAAISHPFGHNSPLPWVVAGVVFAVAATHVIHYR